MKVNWLIIILVVVTALVMVYIAFALGVIDTDSRVGMNESFSHAQITAGFSHLNY